LVLKTRHQNYFAPSPSIYTDEQISGCASTARLIFTEYSMLIIMIEYTVSQTLWGKLLL